MIGRLSTLFHRLATFLRVNWLARAVFYGLIVAAVFLTWLYTGGEQVAFIYSEF